MAPASSQAVATRKPDKPQATISPAPQVVATPNTPTQAPETVAPPTPLHAPLPPIAATGSFYLVQMGPIASSDRASEIAGQLTLAGFAARTTRREEPQLFRVVTDPLLQEVAERSAVALAQQGYHPAVNILADGRAQLDFGVFPSEEGVAAFAQRVRKVGFNAQVTREGGTFYMITLGPYQQPAVVAIASVVANLGASIQVSPPGKQTYGSEISAVVRGERCPAVSKATALTASLAPGNEKRGPVAFRQVPSLAAIAENCPSVP